jgi:lactoylglutathione lyase
MEAMRAHRKCVPSSFTTRTVRNRFTNLIYEPNFRKRGETTQIKKLTPNLVVRNVEASLKFYREILGLEKAISVPDESPYIFASVSNGSVEIFFNDQKTVVAEYPKLAATIGGSLTLYMEVDNLQVILDRVQKAGAKISMPVTDQFYGMKEFAFEDGEGYTITIAQKME